jgi:hypothetical protein
MSDILEAFIKVMLDKNTLEKFALFFGGFLACLFTLDSKYHVFERIDTLTDLMREVAILLKEINKYRNARDIKRRIERGEDIDSGDF